MITIEFGYSTSFNYSAAVARAKRSPIYESEGSDRNVLHRTKFPLEDFRKAARLFDIVSGWKSSRLLIHDDPAKWTDIQNLYECWNRRRKNEDEYCQPPPKIIPHLPLGCTVLRIELDDWYRYGRIENGRWRVDKDEISKLMKEVINRKNLELCPRFNKQQTFETLERLSEFIEPINGWRYNEELSMMVWNEPINQHLLPDLNSREHLFNTYVKEMHTDESVNVWQLALRTHGYSKVEIESVCREASFVALERAMADFEITNSLTATVTMADFEFALKTVRPI